ncbi:MAG TPA: glycosyltransferase family 39 protein [Bryobacteraceae bacterium]
MSLFRRYLPFATLALAIAAFYLYQLDGVGVLGPDEPRYVAIGQAMAHTGDLVTPRLWGSPWFEKPPLLYWMTAAGTALGLAPEMAARLPVALLSLAFLVVAFELLRTEFGGEVAGASLVLLATSAGWVAYSELALTDLPLAAFFSLAIFLSLPLVRESTAAVQISRWRFIWIGACLGMAMLAKGLVPLVLFVPGVWFLRRWWRHWWLGVLACVLIAGPWYVGVYAVNGKPFLEDFFWKQHFQRLYSTALQHVQPWYFYVPVLLGGLFPWTPLFAFLVRRAKPDENRWDARRLFLLATAGFGFLFFSFSLNKLPGYLIPLIPSLFVLLGSQFERKMVADLGKGWLLAPALLIACIPVIAHGLPGALEAGRIAAFRFSGISATELFYVAAPILAWLLARRSWRAPLLILSVVAGGIYLKVTAYPVIDQTVSARPLWEEIQSRSASICEAGIKRDWLYGLNFYRGVSIPPCGSGNFDFELRAQGRRRPELVSRKAPLK